MQTTLLPILAAEIVGFAHATVSYAAVNAAAGYAIFAPGVIGAVHAAVVAELRHRGLDPQTADGLVHISEGQRVRFALLIRGHNCQAAAP